MEIRMKQLRFISLLVLILVPCLVISREVETSRITLSVTPRIVVSDLPTDLVFKWLDEHEQPDSSFSGWVTLQRLSSTRQDTAIFFHQGSAVLKQALPDSAGIHVHYERAHYTVTLIRIPNWLSLMPPVIAILLAILFRQVLIALFSGIWLGAFIMLGYSPWGGLARVLNHYLIEAVAHPDHAAIILFSMTLGGMVGIITRSGGTQGIIRKLAGWADHPKRGQIAAWAMGLLIFFDDYANTLIVGNTFRPVTDRLGISREKLSYIVDSTAAPVVSIAVFSTWIGFELGLLQNTFENLGLVQNVYWFFISTLPFRFYSILTILFVLGIAMTGRDFGPMLSAERRARLTGQVLRPGSNPLQDTPLATLTSIPDNRQRARNALFPILVVILTTLLALYFSGQDSLNQLDKAKTSIRQIFGASNPFQALLWAGFMGSLTAGFLALIQRLLSIRQIMDAWVEGVKSMVLAMIVIVFAWSIGEVCKDLRTAEVVVLKTSPFLSPHWMPALTFLIAALISFATGTSWGAMAILIPVITPLAWIAAGATASHEASMTIFTSTLASVLSGSIWGDHCSPISDTTIMSSMASGADHIDHVRTQLPYALVIGIVSIITGYLPAGFGWHPLLSLITGCLCIGLLLKWVARPVGITGKP
jgi:Na+/H+ antiporter NhaC